MIKTRALKISVIGLLLIMACAFALVLFNLNKIIANNKDYFLAAAGQNLRRTLSAGRIHLSIWNGVRLRLVDFAMSDDPAFSAATFLRADELAIDLKLLPLLKREAEIKRLALQNPEILIIRDEEGVFNFSTIGRKTGQIGVHGKIEEHTSLPESTRATVGVVSLLAIKSGRLRYTDRKERIDLPLEKVDFKVKDFLPGQASIVELSAALLADKPNLKLQARVGPIDPAIDLADLPLDLQITIDALDTAKLKTAVPRIKSYLPRLFDFSGVLSVKDMRIKGTLRELNLGRHLRQTSQTWLTPYSKPHRRSPAIDEAVHIAYCSAPRLGDFEIHSSLERRNLIATRMCHFGCRSDISQDILSHWLEGYRVATPQQNQSGIRS